MSMNLSNESVHEPVYKNASEYYMSIYMSMLITNDSDAYTIDGDNDGADDDVRLA